mmetsp:Transcript_16355/g.35519  ORF Transcript_16355/g.35519 Transcript_16355/m.35519 type:complete len:175 (-) Transcript_16355:551-1075(-)
MRSALCFIGSTSCVNSDSSACLRYSFISIAQTCCARSARFPPSTSNQRIRAARVRFGARYARIAACSMTDGEGEEELVLSEENVQRALEDAKVTLGTLFGNSEQNRGVGITGDVELADVDGPTVVLRLRGRFWHKRADVLARVANYLQTRIPEIFEVSIEDPQQLDDSEKNALL